MRPWQSREGSCDFADRFPTMRPGTARFPRRFAPRNDKLGGIARSPGMPPYLQLPMALNPRKGDAASVRRQSRQRLRSKRRYRRNRLVRFYRQPVRIGSACPRLPRAQSALAMTNLLALRHRIRAAKPTACKAVTDRRYRRNWCIPFSRRPVRIGSLAKLSTFHFLFSTRRMPSPYNAPSMPPPFPSASSHTCFASSTARGRRIIPARPNRR